MNQTRLHRRAFTLIEVLIAILLILAIGAGAFTLFSQIAAARERLSEHLIRRQGLDSLTRELERAIAVCYAGGQDGVFRGTDSKIEIPCRVVRLGRGGGSPLLGHLLSIRFDESTQSIVAATGGGSESVMVADVAKFAVKYFDGRSWAESFDASTSGGLPHAIEVSVWWRAAGASVDSSDELSDAAADAQLVISVPDAGNSPELTMTSRLRKQTEFGRVDASPDGVASFACAKGPSLLGGAA